MCTYIYRVCFLQKQMCQYHSMTGGKAAQVPCRRIKKIKAKVFVDVSCCGNISVRITTNDDYVPLILNL